MVGPAPLSLAKPTEEKKTEKRSRGTSGQVERRVRVDCVHEVERPLHREAHEPTRCHHFSSSGFRSRAPLILLRILSTRKSIRTYGTIYCSIALESRTLSKATLRLHRASRQGGERSRRGLCGLKRLDESK